MVTSPCWEGDWGLSATFRYPSGGFHGAWDVRTPIGTKIFAVRDGRVIDQNHGVPNNRPGHSPGSGAPSNYVLLGFKHKGKDAAMYYQHLTGTVVHDGQHVEAGQLLGYTGNSGHSTGPHLHLSTQWTHSSQRYLYLSSAYRIYPPSEVWRNLPPQWPGEKRLRQAIHGKEYEFVGDIKKALHRLGYTMDNLDSDLLGDSAQDAVKRFKRRHYLTCKDPSSPMLGRDCWNDLMRALS